MSDELIRVKGIGPASASRLQEAGVNSIEDIADSTPEELAWIKGIGDISAKQIIENAKEILKLEKGIQKVLNSIRENFLQACPKCGGPMTEKYIILNPGQRLKVQQCKVCKFYMPK